MQELSAEAAATLGAMEPNREYGIGELRALFPETSMDALRETMHELWVNRLVESFDRARWRRQASTCASKYAPDPRSCVGCPIASSCGHCTKPTTDERVGLERLLDQPAFGAFFKDDSHERGGSAT